MTQELDVREQQIGLGGGATLHVVEGGDPQGRPVVLLHGLSDSWRSYRLVLPLLAECGRLILPDLRGHGDSSAPRGDDALATMAADVTSLLERLGGGPAVLVGHSMGSFVARRIALEAPDRVAGLVLVGGALTARNDAV